MEQLPEFDEAPLRPFAAIVGGSPVPQALVETWGRRGVALTTVYGITEAGACVTAMPPGRELNHNGTVGLPLLYSRCRVQTPDDRSAAPGETGELQLSGPLLTPGYWRNDAATAEAFTADGWFHTGDAATMTEDGHVVLVDRWKDMYISGGENVYPAEVENVLHAHPAVNQAAVVGAPHPRWGEADVAFVVLTRGADVDLDGLRAWCRDRLARTRCRYAYSSSMNFLATRPARCSRPRCARPPATRTDRACVAGLPDQAVVSGAFSCGRRSLVRSCGPVRRQQPCRAAAVAGRTVHPACGAGTPRLRA